MKNAMVIPVVLVITLLISMLIGTYMMSSSVHISQAFNRDLAEVRGYWGAYGAKELNISNIAYNYNNYNIDVHRKTDSTDTWEWNLTISSGSGIDDNDLYHRKIIVVDENNPNEIESYER